MSNHTITESLLLKTETCACCGVVFAMPAILMEKLRESGARFYCPSGHYLTYGPSEADKLRAELEAKKRELTASRCETIAANDRRAAAERMRDTALKDLTRHKRRTKAGVCPCCKRSFQALARHIAAKHPEFKP